MYLVDPVVDVFLKTVLDDPAGELTGDHVKTDAVLPDVDDQDGTLELVDVLAEGFGEGGVAAEGEVHHSEDL